jgi:hypothetical protein
VLRDPREHGLELREELHRVCLQRARAERVADRPAGVVDEDARPAGLAAGDLPGVLVARVGVRLAVEAEIAAVAPRELQLQLRVVPMPSSLIAVCLSGRKPAAVMSTEWRRIENGTVRTTLSATTVVVPEPRRKVRVYVASPFSTSATSSEPVSIRPSSSSASRSGTWSLPPRTWYFSSERPNTLNWPWPWYASR